MVVEAAGRAGIPVSICGGAAGEPHMAPLLIGLGLRELSMAPQSIPFIKAAIRTMSLTEAEKLVADAFALDTPEEIEQLVVRFMEGKLTTDWN
jgi:phosphotransferase system enzyme I (PtsI)